MNVRLDETFKDQNGLWVVCFRTDTEWLRLRFTAWEAFLWLAQIRYKQWRQWLFGTPFFPITAKEHQIESGPRVA
jgi:hypothetical protein